MFDTGKDIESKGKCDGISIRAGADTGGRKGPGSEVSLPSGGYGIKRNGYGCM